MSGGQLGWWSVAVLAVALLALTIVRFRVGKPLRGNGFPRVAGYARAEDPRVVRRILGSWGDSGRTTARRVLRLGLAADVLTAVLFAVAAVVVGSAATTLAGGSAGSSAAAVAGAPQYGLVAMLGPAAIGLAVLAGVARLLGTATLLAQLGAADRPSPGRVTVSLWSGRVARLSGGVVAMYVLIGYGVLRLVAGPGW